jgi:hypothetical protein
MKWNPGLLCVTSSRISLALHPGKLLDATPTNYSRPWGKIMTSKHGLGGVTTLIIILAALAACGGGGGGGAAPPAPPTYTIGGTVSGLGAGKSVVLQNNSGDNLTVSADGAFTFTASMANSATYVVSAFTQPVLQTCTIANASGTVIGANVTNVSVTCVVSIALPKTGQTLCYDATGTIACAGTGQDGDLQTGVTASPRFTVDGTGNCVTDNLSGLMWVRAPGFTGATWVNALTAANSLDLCGFTDWRLPNRAELDSLSNYGVADNAAELNASGFSNIAGWYWSSTTIAGNPTNAGIVGITNGHVLSTAKSNTYPYTWPVRAGQ